ANGRAVDGSEQGQRVREPRGEGGFVVRDRRPRLLLGRAVVLAGQFGDAGAKDFSQQRRIRRQKRPQRRLYVRHHRDTFQVVVPSLWSSSSTPIALSSSRTRSASLKFFRLARGVAGIDQRSHLICIDNAAVRMICERRVFREREHSKKCSRRLQFVLELELMQS